MKDIKELFAGMYRWRGREIADRSAARDVLKEVLNVDVPLESIKFKGNTIVIEALSQSAKSEIFIKKASILKALAGKLPFRNVKDIR